LPHLIIVGKMGGRLGVCANKYHGVSNPAVLDKSYAFSEISKEMTNPRIGVKNRYRSGIAPSRTPQTLASLAVMLFYRREQQIYRKTVS
jgi:hypothetical protein